MTGRARRGQANEPPLGDPEQPNPPNPPAGGVDSDDDNEPDDPLAQPPPNAPAPRFSTGPGQVGNVVIDYDTPMGYKLYQSQTKPQKKEFDGDEKNFHRFLNELNTDVRLRGWRSVNMIPNADGTHTEWIGEFGSISHQTLYDYYVTFVNEPTREAQKSAEMFQYLRYSITEDFKGTIHNTAEEPYIINGQDVGPLFLKKIFSATFQDLEGTDEAIRETLLNCQKKLVEVNYDIKDFDEFLHKQISQLETRNQGPGDIFLYVIKAYKTVPDQPFVDYINKLHQEHRTGRHKLTIHTLRRLAIDEFGRHQLDGEWMQPTKTDQKIVAMTAEIEAVKEAAKKEKLQLEAKLKKAITEKSKKRKGGDAKADGNKNKKGKSEQKGQQRELPAWKKEKKGATIKRDGKTYHWCDKHGYYCIHKPSDCNYQPPAAANVANADTAPPSTAHPSVHFAIASQYRQRN